MKYLGQLNKEIDNNYKFLATKGYSGTFLDFETRLEDMAGKSNTTVMAGTVSPNRLLMYSAQTKQRLTLCHGERPFVGSNLRNDIFRSSFNSVAENPIQVLHRVDKTVNGIPSGTKFIIYQDLVTGIVHCHEHVEYQTINEGFGVKNECAILTEDKVDAGEFISRTNGFDEDGSFIGEGLNVRTATLLGCITIEDAFLMTKSTAERFATYETGTIEVDIDASNDWLRNLYGGADEYRPIPNIGETVGEDNIVMAIAKQVTRSKFIRVSNAPSMLDRRYFFDNGTVYDIDILAPKDIQINNEYLSNIRDECVDYMVAKKNAIESILSQTENVSFLMGDIYKNLKAIIDEGFGYRRGTMSVPLNKLTIRIHMYEKNVVQVGDKFSGTYGNKGIVGKIVEDSDAYMDEYGNPIELMFNPLACGNRAIAAPLIVSGITSLAFQVRNHVFNTYNDGNPNLSRDEITAFILRFIEHFSKDDHDTYVKLLKDIGQDEWLEFMRTQMIHWQLDPYSCGIEFAHFFVITKALKNLGVKAGKMQMYRYGEKVGKPICIGWQYIYRLKHTASKKMSVRTYGSVSITGAFSKSQKKKHFEALHADTPVKYSEYVGAIINNCLSPIQLDKMLFRDEALKSLEAWSPILGVDFSIYKDDPMGS